MFQHPRQVCMTYWSHCCLSLTICKYFVQGALYAFIHAFIPDIFTTQSSMITNTILDILQHSGCRTDKTL